jgi:uncharacterized protein YecE (DUF72 family)
MALTPTAHLRSTGDRHSGRRVGISWPVLSVRQPARAVAWGPVVGGRSRARVITATTPKLAMIRLHGRNAGTWYKRVEKTGHRFDYIYPPHEIEEIAANVRLLAQLSESVHVAINTNNNAQGPINALALAEILGLPYSNGPLLADLRQAVGLES